MDAGYDGPARVFLDWTFHWPSTAGSPDSARVLPHLLGFFAAWLGVRMVRSTYARISALKKGSDGSATTVQEQARGADNRA